MNGKGVQNAQLQGPQSTGSSSQDVAACWWNIYAEGNRCTDGLNKF